MKKDFYDIIPNERRTIRNIPITKKTETSIDQYQTLEVGESSKIYHINPHEKHSIDGVRAKPLTTKKRSPHAHKDHEEKKQEIEPEMVDEDFEIKKIREEKEDDFDSEESFEEWRGKRKNSFWRGWVALGTLTIAGIIIFSIFFGSATITINPVKRDLVLKDTDIALNSIKHEFLSTEITKSKDISADGTIKIDRKATGKVILYNAFNSSTQKLVEGTRLETPNGLVYKLKNTVIIPAQKNVGGKKVPGSIEADIEASETGEKYNQGFKDFNIVAYKGSDRYNTIYGRSKTALSNGYSGVVPNILSKDINTAVTEIKGEISKTADEYFKKEAISKGGEFVYIETSKQITYGEIEQKVSKDRKKATITLNAKITAPLFDSTDLFTQIIKKQPDVTDISTSTSSSTSIEEASAQIVYIGDASTLKVNITTESNILVSGTTTISSAIDIPKVKKAVSGLEKEQAISAIKQLVELESIEIDIRPWWNKKLPSSDKIEIKTDK